MSKRLLIGTFLPLLISLSVSATEATKDGKSSESQLRKVLYPTYYSRNPFEMDKWEFYGGNSNNKAYVLSPNPMSRYSDLFDRNLRSDEYIIIEKDEPFAEEDKKVLFESGERPEQAGFLPVYTGRGK